MQFFRDRIDKELFARLENVLHNPFRRVPYTEAVDILLKSGRTWEFPVAWGKDLQKGVLLLPCVLLIGGVLWLVLAIKSASFARRTIAAQPVAV